MPIKTQEIPVPHNENLRHRLSAMKLGKTRLTHIKPTETGGKSVGQAKNPVKHSSVN